MMEQEIQSDLLIGVSFTDKKRLIDLKSQRERILEIARHQSITNQGRENDQKVLLLEPER